MDPELKKYLDAKFQQSYDTTNGLLTSLTNRIITVEKKIEELPQVKLQVTEYGTRIDVLEATVKLLTEELAIEREQNSFKHDNCEQNSKLVNLQINGIPQGEYIDPEQVVIKIAEALPGGIALVKDKVRIAHRIRSARRGTKQPIIVAFYSAKAARDFLNSFSNRNRTTPKLKVKDLDLPFDQGVDLNTPVYINQQLSVRRKHLLYMTGVAKRRYG